VCSTNPAIAERDTVVLNVTGLLGEVEVAGHRMLHDVHEEIRSECHRGRTVAASTNRVGGVDR